MNVPLCIDLCSSQHANTVAEETQVPGKGKAPNKKAKDYCPDSHCGVWIDKEDRHCVKSLTCKVSYFTTKAVRKYLVGVSPEWVGGWVGR